MRTMNPDDFNPNERAYPFEDGTNETNTIRVTKDRAIFVGQRGPIQEVGPNGCQIDDMVKFARMTIQVFNKKFPCRENSIAITKLQEAEMWLRERTRDRDARGVEGKNKA